VAVQSSTFGQTTTSRGVRFGVVAAGVVLALVVLSGAVATSSSAGPSTASTAGLSADATTTTPLAGDTPTAGGAPSLATQQGANGSVEIRRSRAETVVNTPVTLETVGDFERHEWGIVDAPAGSEATLRNVTAGVVSLQPDQPGEYEVQVSADGETGHVAFTARAQTAVLAEYAPRLHFHPETTYQPTRIEALAENANLRRAGGELVAERPLTAFDLAGRDDSHYLELPDSRSEYSTYEESFEPTLYANYVPNVTVDGEQYAAINYWFVTTFDPKHGFARFGAHQADVEWTTLLLQDGDPVLAFPAAHGAETRVPYEQWAGADGRLDLYPESRSHATYLRNTAAFDGEGYQVYGSCGEVARFESTFHNEHTGNAETWSPDGSTGTEYTLVELTGNESWASYAGGFSNSPASITGPHERGHFDDPAGALDGTCPDREQVEGSLTVEAVELTDDGGTVDAAVANDGGKPHEFWVTVEDANGTVLGAESVRVGTTRWSLVSEEATVTVPFDGNASDVTAELWLHPPETRQEADRVASTQVVENGEVVAGGVFLPFGVPIVGGVAVVVLGAQLYRRRRYYC